MALRREYSVGDEVRSVDYKGRVMIPDAYGINGDVYLKVNKDKGFIDVIPSESFDEVKKGIEKIVSEDDREEEFRSLSKVKMDNKRRLIIPKSIRRKVGHHVSIIGMGDTVRIRFKYRNKRVSSK